MINDPFELTLGVRPPETQEEEPEDPFIEHQRIFNLHKKFRPDDTSYHNPLHVAVCRFNQEGKHVQAGKYCPHYTTHDEEGPRIRSNWTAQQG